MKFLFEPKEIEVIINALCTRSYDVASESDEAERINKLLAYLDGKQKEAIELAKKK